MIDLSRRIRALLIVDAVLVLAIAAGLLLSPSSVSKRSAAFDLLKRADAVASISMNGTETVELTRSGDSWMLKDADGLLPADSGRVKSFIGAVDAVDGRELVARNKDAWAKLGLEGSQARHVQLGDADGAGLAEFTLGSYAKSPGTVYLSLPDGPAAYAVSSGMASYILGGRNTWLDLRVWSAPPAVEQVQELVVQGEIELKGLTVSSYRVTRAKGSWESGGTALDTVKVEAAIRALANMRGSDYAPAAETAGTRTVSVELVLGNGSSLRLSIEAAREDGRFPASSSQRERRLYLPAWAVEEALKPLSAFR